MNPIVAAARAEGRITLNEVESRALLGKAGLRFEPMEVVRSPAEAAAAAVRAGRPVAVKLLSQHLVHKTDAGGVRLGVAADDGGQEAARAFARIVAGARAYARRHGFPEEEWAATVSPMFPAPVAELLIGACRDSQLGPVLTIGAGGILVEVLQQTAHRVLPVDAAEIEAALAELRISALLDGVRGRPAVSRAGIVDAAGAVARSVLGRPEIAEAEVNPLFVYADRVVPIDARVVLRTAP